VKTDAADFALGQAPAGRGPGELGTVALARMLNVSDQTVMNWTLRGLPHSRDAKARYWFVPADCVAWAENNHVVVGGRGGKRSRAGRKPRRAGLGPELPMPPEEGTAERAHFDKGVELDNARDKARAYVEALKTEGGLIDAMLPEKLGGMSLVDAERLLRIMNARLRSIELDQELKRVLPADEVRAAVSEVYQALRSAIQAWPAQLTVRLMSDLGLADDKQRALRAALDRAVEEALARLATDVEAAS